MNPVLITLITIIITSSVAQKPILSFPALPNDKQLTQDQIFNQYMKTFRVPFRRKVNFQTVKSNLDVRYKSVQEQHDKFNKGLDTFDRALYPFSHLSDQELAQNYLGALISQDQQVDDDSNDVNERRAALLDPPVDSFQWPESIVGKVKNQKLCASSYAHAALGVIKSRRAIKYGGSADAFDLSEQDALECTRGCSGGTDYNIYCDYSQRFEGCAAYNYKKIHSYSGLAYTCQAESRPRVPNTRVFSFEHLENNEEVIKKYLYNYGPLYAMFRVHSNFVDYVKGIYSQASGDMIGGHAVMIIGYGVDNGQKYWVLKNSWGTWWGEKGFFRMLRGENLSGIENSVSAVVDL